jgi:nucleotide-binding universal stress UspA family protein
LTEALQAEAQAGLERTARALGGDVQRRVEYGDPAAEIVRVAADEGYDVVVVGSHGSGFVKRVLLGSVSHHVLHQAPCPVLVVRASDHS